MTPKRATIVMGSAVLLAAACVAFAIIQLTRVRHSRANLVRMEQEWVRQTRITEQPTARRTTGLAQQTPDALMNSTRQAPPEIVAKSDPALDQQNWAALSERAMVASINQTLGLFFHRSGITGENAARITERIALHNRTLSDPQARTSDENARLRADLEGLLGPEGYMANERYQKETPHWQQVKTVAARLYDSDTPLTADQADRLGEILVAHATDANGEVTGAIANWNSVIDQASMVLAPPQLEMLEAVREHHQLHLQMNRLRAKNSSAKKASQK